MTRLGLLPHTLVMAAVREVLGDDAPESRYAGLR